MSVDQLLADDVLEIERSFKAPPGQEFDAWTKPELISKWWGPDGYHVSEHQIDAREGGRWRVVMESPQGSRHTVGGVYRAIEGPQFLEFTWAWEQEDGTYGHETVVSIRFTPTAEGTTIVLTQKPFETREARDSHHGGWSSTLDCLERLVG